MKSETFEGGVQTEAACRLLNAPFGPVPSFSLTWPEVGPPEERRCHDQ